MYCYPLRPLVLPQAARAERLHEALITSGPSPGPWPAAPQNCSALSFRWLLPCGGASLVSWGKLTVTRLPWHEGPSADRRYSSAAPRTATLIHLPHTTLQSYSFTIPLFTPILVIQIPPQINQDECNR